MTQRTKPGRATGTAAKRVCRKMFTIDQAADFAGVSVNQIRCWLIARKLDAYDLGGGRVRIDEAELVDFLSSQSKRP